jgi:hypothetical protein
MPSKALLGISNRITHSNQAPFSAERSVEAESPLSPIAPISAMHVPRLMRERRGDSTLGSRVERDAPEGIGVVKHNAPARHRTDKLGTSVSSKRDRQNPALRLRVESGTILHRARGDTTKAAKTLFDRGRRVDGRRSHAKRPLPGVAGPVGCV